MQVDCVVFDFDGTLTDVERHAPAFHAATREALAEQWACGLAEVEQLWSEVDAEQRHGPAELGWVYDGRVVGPARGDPYLIANTIVRTIAERRGVPEPAPLVFHVHRLAYERVAPPFRHDARRVLDEAVARGVRVQVVTNSDTSTVAARLDGLGLTYRDRVVVRGHARKFVVGDPQERDARFEVLPESLTVPGLGRPVWLRRGPYFDVLRQMWGETGRADRTLVVGDLFELDLAMPAALGCAVHLITRPTTLAHERAAALSAERGGAGDVLGGVIERLQ